MAGRDIAASAAGGVRFATPDSSIRTTRAGTGPPTGASLVGRASTGRRCLAIRTADTVSSLSVLALLSQALVGFAVEYESRVPFAIVVGVYLDAAFADGPVPLDDAPPVLMITGNGRSSLERHGAVEVDRSKQVTLTSVGRRLRDAYRPTVAAVESSLEATTPLRAALEGLDVHGVGHADHPDVRFVGGHVGFAEVSARHSAAATRRSVTRSPVGQCGFIRTTGMVASRASERCPAFATGDPWSAGA